MTKAEAVAYLRACEFMRDIKFASTSWKQDAEEDPHLAEALRILGIDSTEDCSTQSKTRNS